MTCLMNSNNHNYNNHNYNGNTIKSTATNIRRWQHRRTFILLNTTNSLSILLLWLNCAMVLASSSSSLLPSSLSSSSPSSSYTASGTVKFNPIYNNVDSMASKYQQQLQLQNSITVGLLSSPSSAEKDDYLSQKENILERSYHGLVRENETLVEITPLLKVDEEKICNFRILKKPYHDIPFQIELVNNLGILKARRTLNCEKRKNYHFCIMAIFCDGTHSASAHVHITVIDINEYSPTFMQPSYVTEVDEGRLYKEIIRVEARDKDCTPLYGDVCKYEILNMDELPFTIDNEGSIKNTEPLSHHISHNHILSVVAYDCAMKQSAPIMISIKVRRVCEAKFLGIPERIDYTTTKTTMSESLSLFPYANLELCDLYCQDGNLHIHTAISLKTKYISFGCDRDIINCSRELLPLIDLLPLGAEWTKQLYFDEGIEPVFHFDGTSGVIVPATVLQQQHDFLAHKFSIATIFRHAEVSLLSAAAALNKHVKEHIICLADDHKMNRHHMALFVRNCRLILLLRKNFNEGDLNIFSPAEWRWKIPQVCDNEWHHYVLNVVDQTTAKVELYIDGAHFETAAGDRHSNPEVIDDWPLHAAHGVNTTLTVGGCYQSSENRIRHGFIGDISEIKISIGNVLSADDVRCGTNCAEHLIPPPEHLLAIDSQVQTSTQLNEVYIEGTSKNNIEQLFRNVQYVNSKENPTIGRRNIEVRTTLICKNQNAIRLPTIETYIMVNDPSPLPSMAAASVTATSPPNKLITNDEPSPFRRGSFTIETVIGAASTAIAVEDIDAFNMENMKLTIIGSSNSLVSYQQIKAGVHILSNINIVMLADANDMTNIHNTNEDNDGNDDEVMLLRYHQHQEHYPSAYGDATSTSVQPEQQILDSCSVIVFPSLNPDHEEIHIDSDESLSLTLDIKTNIEKDGVEMLGTDTIANYMDVLRALVYSNKKPAYYLNRIFKLSCTQLHSQYKVSEFTLTLTVLHPKQEALLTGKQNTDSDNTNTSKVAELARALKRRKVFNNDDDKNVMGGVTDDIYGGTDESTGGGGPEAIENKIFAHALMHTEPKALLHSIINKTENSNSSIVITLICLFVVVFICGVSIACIKNQQYQHRIKFNDLQSPKVDESLAWDYSALTLTINPMQAVTVSENGSESENFDSDDDEGNDFHELNRVNHLCMHFLQGTLQGQVTVKSKTVNFQ